LKIALLFIIGLIATIAAYEVLRAFYYRIRAKLKNKPDKLDFIESPFMFVRKVTHLPYFDRGWGNGYVAVDESHPWFEQHYDNIDVVIHGGLTFSEFVDGYWVVGFDTAHYMDSIAIWPKEAVVKETAKLLSQAIKAKENSE
jgi:hypothetical protein